jgi:integrase
MNSMIALSMTFAGPVAMKPRRSTTAAISSERHRPISQMRKALADARRKGTLRRNVATLADPPKPGRDTAMRVWTPEQLVQFLDEIAEHRLATAFVVAAHTGMRRGEVLGLAWRDLDLDANRLSVRQAVITVE